MKSLLITHPGIEDISQLEVKELIKKDTKIDAKQPSVITFETNKYEDLVKIAYKSQSISKILILLDQIKITKINDIKKLKFDIKDWINKKTSFKVKCKRMGKHSFNSKEIEEEIGGLFIDKYKLKVNLTEPDIIIFAYVYNENLYLGIDITGMNLSKRSYKIFHHPDSLKGTIAYALTRISGYKPNKKIINPFCSDGTIIIETGLFASNFPVRFFEKEKFLFKELKPFSHIDFDKLFKKLDSNIKKDKFQIIGSESLLRHINSCKKNAKISGIDRNVEFRRYDIEWLDTKFNKNEIDFIITRIIEPGKFFDKKKIEKIYKEFFYHTEFVLNKNGKMIILSRKKDLITTKAEEFKLKVNINRQLQIGDSNYYVLEIKK
tara:strand:- start:15155 stop:16285 length:1131 start_codon:yes stop_codon:yes gene_type:complete